jgi:Ubiquinol-cytochrome C chaperone
VIWNFPVNELPLINKNGLKISNKVLTSKNSNLLLPPQTASSPLKPFSLLSSKTRDYPVILFSKVLKRVENPCYGFTSSLDLAPPPQKTLHWKFKPAPGEYDKVRNLTVWSALHVWLLTNRIKFNDHSQEPLCEAVWKYFWDFVETWVVNASVPKLGSQGEVKHFKDVFNSLSIALTEVLDSTQEPLKLDSEKLGFLHYLVHVASSPEGKPYAESNRGLIETIVFLVKQKHAFRNLPSQELLFSEWKWIE